MHQSIEIGEELEALLLEIDIVETNIPTKRLQ